MSEQYRVAGYVKLAKLWERSREAALQYHRAYYAEKYGERKDAELIDVYVDITGQKQIYRRSEMLRLLSDCRSGKVNCIAAQTKGYLAANTQELCYLLQFLFELPLRIDIVTEDTVFRIDTLLNVDSQRMALQKMANDYIALDENAYTAWKDKLLRVMNQQS